MAWKKLSIPMIAGLAVGSLMVLVVIIVLVVKSTHKPPAQQITKKYEIKDQQPLVQPPKPDAALDAANEAERTNRIAMQVAQQLRPQLDSVQQGLRDLQQRQMAIEFEQQRLAASMSARAPVTPRKLREQKLPSRAVPGAKTLAVAGNRAWVTDHQGTEQSVAAGDVVIRNDSMSRRVQQVLSNEQVVITTSGEQIAR